jgi:hypothetical protein
MRAISCPTRTLDDGSAGRVARMVTCWRTLAEAREMLLYGAAEMTTPTGRSVMPPRVKGEGTEPARRVPFL